MADDRAEREASPLLAGSSPRDSSEGSGTGGARLEAAAAAPQSPSRGGRPSRATSGAGCPGAAGDVRRWWAGLLRLFGANFLGAIMLVYFLQGARVGFTNLATDYYFQDGAAGLGLSPARAQVLITISGLPWNIKPCYGILSDAVPLCGTHRRGYLGLMGTLATAGFLLLAALPPAEGTATAALFLTSLGFAFNDVVVDAMVAAGAKKEPATAAGNLQSLAWGSYAVGSILGSVAGGVLYGALGARAMFGIFGLIYAGTVLMALNLREEPARRLSAAKLRLQARLLCETIRVPLVARAACYVFLMYGALPSVSAATFRFWTERDDLPRPDATPPYGGWGAPLPANATPAGGWGWGGALPAREGDGEAGLLVGCEWFAQRGAAMAAGADAGRQCSAPLFADAAAHGGAGAAALAGAVTHCPQACALCDSVRRGCIGFTPAFMGALRAVGHVGYLGGVVLYNARYKATDFRTIFAWAWLVQGLSIVPDLMLVTRANVALGLPDHAFMLGDQILHQMLGQLKHLPFLVLAARICPPHVEVRAIPCCAGRSLRSLSPCL